ncbi:hypothetical protein THAOC_20572 [Thalassiosira oceanica]|uniref:Uncharacterized protein n=1 Tax=Thalassiosira oceanica TaxID=159749 RepID=K0S215_THAOC|nr:hypothetical protein THAOC_20572 [Thalassiosira oceanica]|eukprot:EJK59235.1 hypothetical protein THAOC_20572 [Thalassiosira oceanica]
MESTPQLLSQYPKVLPEIWPFYVAAWLSQPQTNNNNPWDLSKSVHPLPHVCPSSLPISYAVEKHHEHLWTPQLLSLACTLKSPSTLAAAGMDDVWLPDSLPLYVSSLQEKQDGLGVHWTTTGARPPPLQ